MPGVRRRAAVAVENERSVRLVLEERKVDEVVVEHAAQQGGERKARLPQVRLNLGLRGSG